MLGILDQTLANLDDALETGRQEARDSEEAGQKATCFCDFPLCVRIFAESLVFVLGRAGELQAPDVDRREPRDLSP